jgi:drug/metabolite transporter superfamily protein YnfA
VHALAADAVLVVHFAFVLFVVLGGLLVWKWPRLAWAHVPAAAWGVAIEFGGWICPLTPLENHLRRLAGDEPYGGDFIARYLLPVIYPEGLTRDAQLALGSAALLFNLAIYIVLFRRMERARARRS